MQRGMLRRQQLESVNSIWAKVNFFMHCPYIFLRTSNSGRGRDITTRVIRTSCQDYEEYGVGVCVCAGKGSCMAELKLRFITMAPIVFISSPPRSISPAEHRQLVTSTPSSFNDIPPILHHKEDSVAVSLDPPLEGFSTEDGARGILYVTERYLIFGFLPYYTSLILLVFWLSSLRQGKELKSSILPLHCTPSPEGRLVPLYIASWMKPCKARVKLITRQRKCKTCVS